MSTYTDQYTETNSPDQSSMSFLEHLDELRRRLIRIAGFVLIAFIVCWAFADRIYHFLEVPVKAAMTEARQINGFPVNNAIVHRLLEFPDGTEFIFTLPGDVTVPGAIIPAGSAVPVKIQRDEKGAIHLVTVNPWIVHQEAILEEGFVIPPALYAPESAYLSPDSRLVVPTVQGAFNLYIKVAFYAAIFFAVPFILIQVWGFVAPGLYPHEKRYAIPFILMSTIFFVMGCAFAYYIAFPRAANFLLNVAAEGNLRPLVAADDYFDLILTITLGLGVVFEIPTVTFFLSRLGLVTHKLLLKVWRLAVVVIFIIAAVLSPTTDIPNLLVFAAPMMILYALSVGIAWVFYKRRQEQA